MVTQYGQGFEVQWKDPADATKTWLFDSMHAPRPLTHLSQDIFARLLAVAFSQESLFANGYAYMTNPAPLPPAPEVLARGPVAVWEEDYLPRLRAFCHDLRRRNYGSMSRDDLAASLRGIIEEAAQAYRLTMAVTGFAEKAMPLLAFYEREFGRDGSQFLATMTMLQGLPNESAAPGEHMAGLARLAAQHPDLAECLRSGRFEEIDSHPGGSEFRSELDAFLEEYGWRAEGWVQMEVPTWAEEPARALALIARYMDEPSQSAESAIRRSGEQREATIEELTARLSPEKAHEFRTLIDAASVYVPVSESRAMWQLTIGGSMRVPLLAFGSKLVEAGIIERPNDVFYLHLSELEVAGDTDSLAGLVETRKAEYAAWERLSPPPFLGTPPDMSQVPLDFVLFFGVGEPRIKENVISGQPASKGIARGRARVILDLSEASLLQPGEVLVCHTTAPPWTPLFALAAAVVTDTGGVLSHSAICAREYAIPCVVATQVATHVIADGAMVVVDGAAGTVTIEG